MRLSFLASLLVAASFAAYSQTASPRLVSVDPGNGKVGDIVTTTGQNLSKEFVAKLYLTDGNEKNDLQVEIVEQTQTSIKFRIPPKAKGRLALMVLTVTRPQLIEQPVKLTIDEAPNP